MWVNIHLQVPGHRMQGGVHRRDSKNPGGQAQRAS